MRRFFLTLVVILAIGATADAQLLINELMQSNIDCIMDDMNEFPDSWVELYNPSSTTINLGDYSIGVTQEASKAWRLPNQQVMSHKYVIIFCDKVSDKLHADFKLESGNDGAVFLFKNGVIVDQVTGLNKQPAPNISYGRKTNAVPEWGYQAEATPNAANCGKICENILGEPVFSVKGRVFASSKVVTLQLSLPDGSPEGTVIRLTRDGTEPTSSSPAYQGPISINSTQTIRAKLFCDGWLSPRSTTHSYIYHTRNVTLPVISIVTDDKYFYDNKLGIYVEGTYKSGKKNYEYDWRRPINFEYFEGTEVESRLNQLCETRVQGGASRGSQLKSLVVYANKRFGKKRLKHEFFPDQKPGLDNFKSIILRNAGNDFDYLYMRDAIIQRTMAAHTDLDWQAWSPAIFYVNGVYKGMLNIRERSTADNIFSNYNELEDIDMIENWWDLKEGTKVNWNQFQEFYAEHGHTLEEYAQWIDWEEFINLMVMNLFYNNQDFPGNNIVMWRPRTEGGVWRFVAKDTDFGLGLYGGNPSYNTIEWIYNPDYDSDRSWANKYEYTRLFRRMMEDKDLEREFIDRAAIYMGDFMNYHGTVAIWDPMYELIKTEYPHHRKLINQWWPNYTSELNTARDWLAERPNHFYNHLASHYHLGAPVPIQVNLDCEEEDLKTVTTSINGIPLSEGTFKGKFFTGRAMTINSTPLTDKEVTRWMIVTVGTNGGASSQYIEGPTLSFNVPSCKEIIIKAFFDQYDGIDEPPVGPWEWSRAGDILTLEGVERGTPVFIYDLKGILVQRHVCEDYFTRISLPSSQSVYLVKVGDQAIKVR